MIETVTALLLFLNGNMIEHVYKPNLSACLKSKRIASRELNPERVVFSCKIVKAKIEKEKDSKYGFRIVKVLDEKESTYKLFLLIFLLLVLWHQ